MVHRRELHGCTCCKFVLLAAQVQGGFLCTVEGCVVCLDHPCKLANVSSPTVHLHVECSKCIEYGILNSTGPCGRRIEGSRLLHYRIGHRIWIWSRCLAHGGAKVKLGINHSTCGSIPSFDNTLFSLLVSSNECPSSTRP